MNVRKLIGFSEYFSIAHFSYKKTVQVLSFWLKDFYYLISTFSSVNDYESDDFLDVEDNHKTRKNVDINVQLYG